MTLRQQLQSELAMYEATAAQAQLEREWAEWIGDRLAAADCRRRERDAEGMLRSLERQLMSLGARE
ncbi:MAG: hypothetical protein GEU88_19340 [Solirubrobacterales bacterium]|nr:hypothetical protein [Solirubrobacterales bacterium]